MRFLKTGLAAGFFAALLALSGCKEAPEPAAPAQGAVETVVPAALQSFMRMERMKAEVLKPVIMRSFL